MDKNKSDKGAKNAFVRDLLSRGFDASIVKTPADILAVKDGQKWFFEIKMTRQTDSYFGGATLTEWAQALADPDHFRFVVAICKNDEETDFDFIEYTPAEFMEFSTIPPFKVFFNIDFTGKKQKKKNGKSKSVKLTESGLAMMQACFDKLREGQDGAPTD